MNQVAVVIGGGQTLGEFLSRGLAAQGYRVAVVDIQSDKATRVAQAINDEYRGQRDGPRPRRGRNIRAGGSVGV